MIHVLSGKGITNVAGVIRVSYPANSTLVITDGSSGKQFAKDTNTTSSAKAYIFLAPIGDASYTLTATNTAGKTASKQVYVAKDQVQSVVLTYELVLFNNGVVSGYAWDSSKTSSSSGTAQVSNGLIHLGGTTWDDGAAFRPGWGEIGISSAIGLSDYSTLKVHLKKIDSAAGTVTIQVGTTALGDNTATKTVTLTAGTTTSLDISSITGSKYISLYAQSNTGAYGNMIKAYFDKVWLE